MTEETMSVDISVNNLAENNFFPRKYHADRISTILTNKKKKML